MKKLTLLLIMLIPVMVFSQGYTGDYFKARNYVQAPMFRTATDTVYRLGGLKADSIYLKSEGTWYKTLSSSWTTTGSDIYYNTGNVGIGTDTPAFLLDVAGLFASENVRTDFTSQSTRLGYLAGAVEDETTARNNVFVGFTSGNSLTTATNNVFVGFESGKTINTSNNIFIGYKSGIYETGSNKLFIDALDRTDEATARTSALMYGIFHASPGNQRLTVNGRFDSDNIETNGTSNSVRLGISSLSNEDETTARYNVALGHQAGGAITTGNSNIMIGTLAGGKTTTSAYNVFIGRQSGYDNITGEKNTYVGYLSGENSTGSSNVFIGHQAGYYETGSNKLFIDNQPRTNEATSRTSSLMYGTFDATPANQTLSINANVTIPYNLTVGQRLIHEGYETAAYLDPDSTITTAVTTNWTYLGTGANNKFTNIYSEGFSLTADTIVFNQETYDTRDSVEFRLDYSCATATDAVNKTISYTIRLKSTAETTWREVRQVTRKTRTSTAGVYYSGSNCSTMPIYLKDGDKIQISVKNAASTCTVSTQDFGIYLREE